MSDLTVEGDIEEYETLMTAFKNLGFSEEEIEAIHRITIACLFIGELQLDESTYNQSAKPAPTPVSVKNRDILQQIASLLGIDKAEDVETEIVNKEKGNYEGRAPDKP